MTDLDKAVNNMSHKMNHNEKLFNRKINNAVTEESNKQIKSKEKIIKDNKD